MGRHSPLHFVFSVYCKINGVHVSHLFSEIVHLISIPSLSLSLNILTGFLSLSLSQHSNWVSLEIANFINNRFKMLRKVSPFPSPSPKRYSHALFSINFNTPNPFNLTLSPFSQYSHNRNGDEDVDTIFHTINTHSPDQNLRESLKKTGIFLSNDLIDQVLKRVRFSHTNPLQALEFFSLTGRRKGFYHTADSYDTMLYILGRNRKFEKVWEILTEMRRKDRDLITTRTVQIVLARIAKVCSVRQTVESFRKFRKLCVKFDTTCYNALFRTLCQEKSMTDARNVYHSLKHEFTPDQQTFNILLSGWKSPEEAEGFFEEMNQMGVRPDLVSYNCMVDVYCKNRDMEKAVKLVEKMRNEEIYPDVITYTSIIGGLGLIGQPDKARGLLKEMKEYGCYPDVPAYNAAIRNFCIAKRLGDAYQLMDEMVIKGLYPNPTTYNLFLRVFYWANDLGSAWRLYGRMMDAGCWPNTQSCMFLIRLFRKQEKVEMAMELWGDMVEKGFGSFSLVSDVLFDLLCDMGRLAEAEKCFLEMVEKGQKPSNVSFRRIKVLMELASKHEALRNLSAKMEGFGHLNQLNDTVDRLTERSSPLMLTC